MAAGEGDVAANIRREAKLGLFGDVASAAASSFILAAGVVTAAGAGGPSEGNFMRGDFVTIGDVAI